MRARTIDPAVGPAGAAFLIGLLLGTALVAPVLSTLLVEVPSIGGFGTVGTVLIVSLLSIITFVVGFAAIYFGLFLVEDS